MPKKMIFFHPLSINNNGSSGSQVRPYRMLSAFKELGYDVTSVTGDYTSRKKIIINEVLGNNFDFLYGESANTPLLLTNKYRIPTYYGYDQKMLKYLNIKKIPIGFFFRDIYWSFPGLKYDTFLKRLLFKPLWFYELKIYRKYCSKFFMPTLEMAKHIPIKWNTSEILSLPPGCQPMSNSQSIISNSKNLNLLYIGNVAPPLYDMRMLFSLIARSTNIKLDVICRHKDWQRYKHLYDDVISSNTSIHHISGEALLPFYKKADIFITYREHHPYLDVTLPIKVHEAWSLGLPVILRKGGIDAKWVELLDGGWTVDNEIELSILLEKNLNNRGLILKRKKAIENIVNEHSWTNRAKYISEILMDKRIADDQFF